MNSWLGENHTFIPQTGNDLGQRMANAFTREAAQRAEQMLLIGSDYPGISAGILLTGFKELSRHDLVIGPAADGGYYLIGLTGNKNKYLNIFSHINWGCDTVLSQTLNLAHENGLQSYMLPQLHDIDRPEDLVHFSYHTCS